ncbi:MAG: DUF4363 family protein [Clostridia bacterium]|nr:DUF4363 family protein [Clostridia bacterium]
MRRLGAVLLLFAALCAVSTIVSEEVVRVNVRAEAGVKESIALAEKGEEEEARETLSETAALWQKSRRFLETILHHETIEHAEEGFLASMRALDVSREVFLMEAEKLAMTLHTLSEGDAAVAGNVF